MRFNHYSSDDLYEALDRAQKLDETGSIDRKAIKAHINDAKKLENAAKSVKCRLTRGFKQYALEDSEYVDAVIEDELLHCGKALCEEFPKMKFWSFGEDDKLCDMYGNYCVVETGTEEGRILVQIDGDGRIYDLDVE